MTGLQVQFITVAARIFKNQFTNSQRERTIRKTVVFALLPQLLLWSIDQKLLFHNNFELNLILENCLFIYKNSLKTSMCCTCRKQETLTQVFFVSSALKTSEFIIRPMNEELESLPTLISHKKWRNLGIERPVSCSVVGTRPQHLT